MVAGGRAGGGAEREPALRAREHRGPGQTLQATQAHQAYTKQTRLILILWEKNKLPFLIAFKIK